MRIRTSYLKLTLLFVAALIQNSVNAQSTAEVDTIEWNGEQYFVYPFKEDVDMHGDYDEIVELYQPMSKRALKKLGIVPFDGEEFYFDEYGSNRKRKHINRKFKKAARANPYPLLEQNYRINYDLIPALDPIPDGKYVQLFNDFCLPDKKGNCEYQREVVAAVFTLKDNMLHGNAVWMNVKGDSLKYGDFKNGLKDGVWVLEDRDAPYSISEYSAEAYIEDGHPFIDTTVEIMNFENGVLSGDYKKFERSEYPIEEGTFLNGEPVGEWVYREVRFLRKEGFEYKQRDRNNKMVSFRMSFADISDSVIVKQPWIRDGLISHYSSGYHFDFYPEYDIDDIPEDLFSMAFKTEEDLDLDEENFDSYDLSGYNSGYYRGRHYDGDFHYYQPTIYDENRERTFARGYVIDSIGMIAKYDGVLEEFYPNGQLKFRYVFEDGKLLKEDTIFWDNGNAHDVIEFLADSNHYVRTVYDYKGEKYKELVYDSIGDFKNIQYYYDDTEIATIEGLTFDVEERSDFYSYDAEDTIDFELTEPVILYRSWYKDDSTRVRNKTYDPATRTYNMQRYNVLGKPRLEIERVFTEEFESWNGTINLRYDNLELVTTASGTFRDGYYKDSFPQDNVLSAHRRFDVAEELVIKKDGQAYTGNVEFNFEKSKFKIGNDDLEIDFASYPYNSKKKDKLSKKMKKRIAAYREKGKGADDPLLNFINSSEHRRDYSSKIYEDFFKGILKHEFSYSRSSNYGLYNDLTIKGSQVPKARRITGYMLDGKPHGLWVQYDQFNTVMVEVPFEKGEIHGTVKRYGYAYPEDDHRIYSWQTGALEDTFPEKRKYFLSSSKEYENGMLNGTSIDYDWRGVVEQKEEFKDNYREGLSIERNELAFSRASYKNGLLDGYVQTYLTLPEQDSILLYDLNFQDGSLQGESKSYHLNGNLSKRGFFLDGMPIEDYEAFDSLGFRYHYVKFEYSYPVEEKIWEENQLSVRYKFNWEDSIYFEPSDITTSQSLERMLVKLGFGNSYVQQPYYGRPSLVEKDEIKYHMTKYYPNDTIARDGALDAGKKYGPWEFYDYEGELLYMVDYKDSILNVNDSIRFKSKGIYTEITAQGDTLYEAYIIEKFEKYDCSHTDHYEIRQLYTIWEESDTLNRMNGYVQNFYDNGVLQNEGKMKDGLPDGVWKYYDPFGKLNQYGVYVQGKRNGRWLSGDLSKTKYLGDICLNPNLPDLEEEIKYRENLLDIKITNYKLGKALNKQFYDVNMNKFIDEDEELVVPD